MIGRIAKRHDLAGIGGLLGLEGDLGDAAGFCECEREWGFTPQGTDELGEQVGLGVQGKWRAGRSAAMSVTCRSTSAVSMTPRDPAIRSRSSPWVRADSGRR